MLAPGERRVADVRAPVNATEEALYGATAENPSVGTLPPWNNEPRLAPTVHTTSFLGTFTRMVALAPARLDSLPDWWRQHARGERAEIASRLLLEEPRPEPLRLWRIGGSLRSPGRRRSIPIDLWLWPRLDAWTMLELAPKQDVHVGHRYFSSGQRVLDVLCSRLIRELDAAAST
ncbi:MAG: hypothetical protein JWM72_935 [Actinomycetia bacterium]|nr:hypothetical protein [Actinomycetes bacterium]